MEEEIRIRVGDIVVRKSYGEDILFKVTDIKCSADGITVCTLKGVTYRLQADAPVSDLILKAKNRHVDNI